LYRLEGGAVTENVMNPSFIWPERLEPWDLDLFLSASVKAKESFFVVSCFSSLVAFMTDPAGRVTFAAAALETANGVD
jgi:hypothetical protein